MSNLDLDAEPMKVTFGVHAGKTLDEVPRNYKVWLLTQGVSRQHPELYAELLRHVIVLLKAEVHAADAAAFRAGLESIERFASGEDLV